MKSSLLQAPPVYTPFDTGAYSVSAGLSPLSRSFGNGAQDHRVFQFDTDYPVFRANVARCRSEGLARFHGAVDSWSTLEKAVIETIVKRLSLEHSAHFTVSENEGGIRLSCSLSEELLVFDSDYRLHSDSVSPYVSALDALASQIQEDLAIVQVSGGCDRLTAVHVTAPNYWDPVGKLGADFEFVHEAVAGIAPLLPTAPKLMAAMADKGEHQRFAWGLVTDTRLNHHPEPPGGIAHGDLRWNGRNFDLQNPKLFVRVERQVLLAIERAEAFLFCIHPYFIDCRSLPSEHRSALVSALCSMTPASRAYKGLTESFDDIVAWLEAG